MENYEKITWIGSGSYGEVYKVRDIRTNKEYATKIMIPRENQESFNKEVDFLIKASSNSNPYVVRYINSFTTENPPRFVIITEYCGGGDLKSRMAEYNEQGRYIPEETIVKCISQIVLGVAFIHKKKILHRDIKPENILIGTEGDLKVSDFGISRELVTREYATTYAGTMRYMSPEILESKRYDYSSDVWALGCVFHELCCLSPTFTGNTTADFLKEMKKGYDGSRIPKHYDPRIREIITSMLRFDSKSRPTCEELLENKLIRDYIGSVAVINIEIRKYGNGDRYEGELKDNKRNGKGTYFYADGSVYQGEWKNDKENGKGTFFVFNDDKYIGDWKNGKKHGRGIYIFANKSKYEGEFRNDCMEGTGTFYFPDGGIYEGSWKKDREHGKGMRVYRDGGLYDGDWKNGLRHGRGIRVYADSRFEGMWEKDIKKGVGVWRFDDGTVIFDKWHGNYSASGHK